MAEAIVSAVLEQLTSTILQEMQQEIRLVVGVDEEVNEFKRKLRAIKDVLLDAEQKQVKDNSVRRWLSELKDTSYDMEDVLEDWNAAIMKFQTDGSHGDTVAKKKVCCFFPSSCFGIKEVVLCHEIAHRIKDLNKRLDTIAREKDMFNLTVSKSIEKQEGKQTTSLDVDVSKICGRDIEKNNLLDMLFTENSEEQQSLHAISIVGMGGIGKTTLAQLIYNNEEVINYFDKRIWVCVSDPFDQSKIANALIEALTGAASNLSTLQSLLEKVKESIMGKKFFLVLDDVWIEENDKWDPLYNCLKNGHYGSKILITTRKKTVADMMKSNNIIPVNELSKKYCLLLFRKIAFYGWSNGECEEVEEIVEKIVDKCKGLPLAIKTIGSLLHFKKSSDDWQSILDSEMWELEEFEKGIFPPLLLSYYDLPPRVKPCFLYCATFPKDWEFGRNQLICLWMAQGYLGPDQNKMEKIGEKYFDILIARSLIIQEDREDKLDDSIYKVHDIMHDVALFLSQQECFTLVENGFEEQKIIEKTRHLTLIKRAKERGPFPSSISNPEKLHSLLIIDETDKSPQEYKASHVNNFDQLTHLKALYISLTIKEIPKDIGKLTRLKFLDLSNCSGITELPDNLWELISLQTLMLSRSIKSLPEGLGKLTNLRHLILGYLLHMDPIPKQIERLSNLQTLTTFVVGGGNLQCLKNLNKLRGSLRLEGLENSTDMSEVKKAELEKKKDFLSLKLQFGRGFDMNCTASNEHHEKILQAVEPPPKLESLFLLVYNGSIKLPNWMMSLRTLTKLLLSWCNNWECLPSLGKWPFLESLHITGMKRIKRVGKEFLGIESGCVSPSSSKVIVFPKLKHLKFNGMDKWEEWEYGITKEDEEHITVMPCLCSLTFEFCGSLKVLPEDLFQKTTLVKLRVTNSSPVLLEQHEKWRKRKQVHDSPH